MKKFILVFLFMFICIGMVSAEEDILIKKSEVSKHLIENGWQSPHRKVFTLGSKYMTYDRYITTPTNEVNKWTGEEHIILTSYNKEWEKVDTKEFSIGYGEGVFIADNNFFVYSTKQTDVGYDYELVTYDEDFNSTIFNLSYNKVCDETSNYPFCDLTFKDVYQNEEGIYYLVHETYRGESYFGDYNNRKVLKISSNYVDYEFLEVDEQEIKEMFPKYYYQYIVDETKGNNNYYIVDDKVLISGDTLRYYENGEKKFEITNDDYERFGSAKVYHNLIIVIGYINYTSEVYGAEEVDTDKYGLNYSDILFYDLNGDLIGVYEHNYYDYDIILAEDNLVLTNLYVDGVCDVNREGYYTYNGTCKATLTNEVYGMLEKYLSMTKVGSNSDNDTSIKNPNTLPSVNDMIVIGFIALIILIGSNLVKRNNYRNI